MPSGVSKKRRKRFADLITATEVPLESFTPADGVLLMTRFFSEEFPEAMSLLASWGTWDGSGAKSDVFELTMGFDRRHGESDDLVSLRYKIGPCSNAGKLWGWCLTPDEVPAFRAGIEGWAPFPIWGQSRAEEVSLNWEAKSEQPPGLPVQSHDPMPAEEWQRSDDAVVMLETLRVCWCGEEADLDRLVHRYLLACCRAIWALLPMEASRRGVEVAERDIEGQATDEEFGHAEYQAEGAAFFLDPFEWDPEESRCPEEFRLEVDPELKESLRQHHAERRIRIEPLLKDVEAIPVEEMHRMVRSPEYVANVSPRQLLADAAYFADFAMVYPGVRPREGALERYRQFLSASLLRQLGGTLFRPETPGEESTG